MPPFQPGILTPQAAADLNRLAAAVDRLTAAEGVSPELTGYAGLTMESGNLIASNTAPVPEWVRVSDDTPNSAGYYTGYRQVWDVEENGGDGAFVDQDQVYAIDANGVPLGLQIYEAVQQSANADDGLPLFVVVGTADETEEVDVVDSVSAVNQSEQKNGTNEFIGQVYDSLDDIWVDLASSSLTFTLTESATVEILAWFTYEWAISATGNYGQALDFIFTANVDGAPFTDFCPAVKAQIKLSGAGDENYTSVGDTTSGGWKIALAAGSHTVKLQYKNLGPLADGSFNFTMYMNDTKWILHADTQVTSTTTTVLAPAAFRLTEDGGIRLLESGGFRELE